MLELPDSWVWDFWIADTGTEYHLFFLYASRALHDPERRHRRASVGHAVSTDLTGWKRMPDAVVRSDAPAFDDVAIWTGSVIQDDDGLWWMFYTGLSDDPVAGVQRVSAATSADLTTWTKLGTPLSVADPRWYATAGSGEEPWRDPWVFRHGNRWQMLVTARARGGDDILESGVLGRAESTDLRSWTVLPPATDANAGFGQLEVPQVVTIGHRTVLLFNCLAPELADRRKKAGGGIWMAPADSPIGPFDLDSAVQLTDSSRYVGKAVENRAGIWQLLSFANVVDGEFIGHITDPTPLLPLMAAVTGGAPWR